MTYNFYFTLYTNFVWLNFELHSKYIYFIKRYLVLKAFM